MKKLLIVLLAIIFSISSDLNATHYLGGEISWECTTTGNFKFTMKLYRECYYSSGSAATFGATENLATNVPGFSIIVMTRIAGSPKDISPVCNSNPAFPHIFCDNTNPMSGANANLGAVQENVYTSDAAYPNGVPLTGVPPITGWVFSNSSCCRNPSTNITNSTSLSYNARAVMYPYNNQNVSTCFDNSPAFAEIPRTVICTGSPITYNHLAWDVELDSLVYSWGQPLQSTGAPVTTYAAGYSWNSPLPGPMQNPNNVIASIDSNTGEISLTNHTSGAFVTSVKVTSFKCGIKVAEIWREMQIVFLNCGTNSPPNVTAPFKDAFGQFTLFTDTVYAGELVNFTISGTDFGFLPNGTPQTMSLEVSGSQFGNVISSTTPPSMSATTGCIIPPCATLYPAPNPPNNPLSGQFGVQSQFQWQTYCNHLSWDSACGMKSNVYNFIIKVADDYCPAPGLNMSTVTIVIVPPPDLLPPPSSSVITDSLNGNNTLYWVAPIDSFNLLAYYFIYSSTNCNGPFTILDSVFSTTTSYNHIGANGNSYPTYYYIKSIWHCAGYKHSAPSTIVASSFPDVGVSKIISPTTNAVGNNVTIRIKNFGSDIITSCNVSYTIAGGIPITETWTGTLLPCDSVDYTFTSPYNPPIANYILCTNTLLPNDKNSTNDKKCSNITASINGKDAIQNFILSQNIPNPTNKTTSINYFLPKSGNAVFKVVNIVGEIVYHKEYNSQQGENKIELEISNFESGVYYYSLEFEGILKVKKMVVLK